MKGNSVYDSVCTLVKMVENLICISIRTEWVKDEKFRSEVTNKSTSYSVENMHGTQPTLSQTYLNMELSGAALAL